jgi:tetratricopeptide (TPR) repeat protein
MVSKEDLYDTAVDLFGEGKLDDAIRTYEEALAIDPDFVDGLHGLAMAYASKHAYDDAIAIGQRICVLTPDDVLAHTSLSMFYQQKGMIPEAEAESAKARILDWKRQLKGEGSDSES